MKLPLSTGEHHRQSLYHFRLFYLQSNILPIYDSVFWREGDPQSRSEAVIEPA
jgi:hypothetical protein